MKLYPVDHRELIEALRNIEGNNDVSKSRSQPSWSALHWFAVSSSMTDAEAQAHVLKGLDPSQQNDAGDTPLHLAAWQRNAQKVEWLLALGADPAKTNKKGNLPCHQAMRRQHAPLAGRLMEGVDLGWEDHNGLNAIGHWVTAFGQNLTGLPDKESDLGRMWVKLRACDRGPWRRWEKALPGAMLADLRSHRLEALMEKMPQTTVAKKRQRL